MSMVLCLPLSQDNLTPPVTFNDMSGYGNNGTSANTPVFTTGHDGSIDKSVLMNGTSDNILTTNILDFSSGQLTLMGWCYVTGDGDTDGSHHNVLCSIRDAYDYQTLARLTGTNNAYGNINFADNTAKQISGNTALSLNTWYHLCVTYDGANVNLYLNGALDATPIAKVAGLKPPNQATSIGCLRSDAIILRFFKGRLQDVRIYNTALTQPQIRSIMLDSAWKRRCVAWNMPRPDGQVASYDRRQIAGNYEAVTMRDLSGQVDCVLDASGNIVRTRGLNGSANGVLDSSLLLRRNRPLSGQADGVLTSNLLLRRNRPIKGTAECELSTYLTMGIDGKSGMITGY